MAVSEILFYLFKKERLDISNRYTFVKVKVKKKAEKQYLKEVLNNAHLCWFYIISSTRVTFSFYE